MSIAKVRGITTEPDATSRFLMSIAKSTTNGCIEWQRRTNRLGYGCMSTRRRHILAHRYSYALYRGPVGDGQLVLHSCDNAKCVNPEHLRIGTHDDNMKDVVSRGRRLIRFTREQLDYMMVLYDFGFPDAYLRKEFGVGNRYLKDVALRRRKRGADEQNEAGDETTGCDGSPRVGARDGVGREVQTGGDEE